MSTPRSAFPQLCLSIGASFEVTIREVVLSGVGPPVLFVGDRAIARLNLRPVLGTDRARPAASSLSLDDGGAEAVDEELGRRLQAAVVRVEGVRVCPTFAIG